MAYCAVICAGCAAAAVFASAGAVLAKYIQPPTVQPTEATAIKTFRPARELFVFAVCFAMLATRPFAVLVLFVLLAVLEALAVALAR